MAKHRIKKKLDMSRHLVLQPLKTKIKFDIWRGDMPQTQVTRSK